MGNDSENLKSDKDLNAKIYLAWDDKALYVGADVTDDIPMKNTYNDGSAWQGDAIEIVLGTDPDADLKRYVFTKNDFQFFLSTGDLNKGMKPSIWYVQANDRGEEGDIKVKNSKKGYILEAKILWKNFKNFKPVAGKSYGFDLALDDADETGTRESQAVWFGNTDFYKNPAVWNLIKLVK